MKRILFLLVCMVASMTVNAQNVKGVVISVEDGMVNIDLTRAQVKAGDELTVTAHGGYMTDPSTGRRMKAPEKTVGTIRVINAYSEYSVAEPINGIISAIKQGMNVLLAVKSQPQPQIEPVQGNQDVLTHRNNNTATQPYMNNNDKPAIVIAPATVNDVVNNGHFGGYVADMLMEQMVMCDKVRLLDRSVLNAQMDEIELAGRLLDPNTTIQRGKAIGARYILQTTMQKPDVVNIGTGVPIRSIMGAVQGLTGTNIGAGYASNMKVAKLKSSVSISVRVVDLQTGEIVFMTSATGQASGKTQMGLEMGALGGGYINGGAEGFKQTVTGKAIQQAFMKIGRNLVTYFSGNTDRKVIGSISGAGAFGDKLYAKGNNLYSGTQKIYKDDAPNFFSGNDNLYFQYRSAKKKIKNCWWAILGGVVVGGALGAALDNGTQGNAASIAAGVSSIGGLVCCFCIRSSGRKALKRVARQYNQQTSDYCLDKSHYDTTLSLSPTGLTLTF